MFKFSFQPTELNENFSTTIPNKKSKVGSSNNDTNEEEEVTTTSGTTKTADDKTLTSASTAITTTTKTIPCLPFEEIHPTKEQLNKSTDEIKYGIMKFAGGLEILHLKCDGLIKDVVESQIIKQLEEKESILDETTITTKSKTNTSDGHSTDLIPGVYEGKISYTEKRIYRNNNNSNNNKNEKLSKQQRAYRKFSYNESYKSNKIYKSHKSSYRYDDRGRSGGGRGGIKGGGDFDGGGGGNVNQRRYQREYKAHYRDDVNIYIKNNNNNRRDKNFNDDNYRQHIPNYSKTNKKHNQNGGQHGYRYRVGGGKIDDNRHPWFNDNMLDLIKLREKAHRKWLANKNRSKTDQNWQIFTKIRNEVTTLRHSMRNDFLVTAMKIDGLTSARPWQNNGGGKIWECTQDLGDYLTKTTDDNDTPSIFSQISGKYILDLGCGAGILGLLALISGANVHFQDYNREILSKITIQNAILNCEKDNNQRHLINRCKFYAGDWSNYIKSTEYDGSPMFDIILTSETIYNPQNMEKILNVFKRKLKRPNGVAYLAAKTYYFGVGGGIRAFESLVKNDGKLCTEVVWKTNENVQREILKITRKLKK